VIIQVIMVGLVIAFPGMVMHYKGAGTGVDPSTIQQLDIPQMDDLPPLDLGPPPGLGGEGGAPPGLAPPALPGLEGPPPGLEGPPPGLEAPALPAVPPPPPALQ